MSLQNKVIAAMTPVESAANRARAASVTQHGDWLSVLLQHHLAMEEVLARANESREEEEQRMAFAAFSILTGDEIVEDNDDYPGLSAYSEIGDSFDSGEYMATGRYGREFD